MDAILRGGYFVRVFVFILLSGCMHRTGGTTTKHLSDDHKGNEQFLGCYRTLEECPTGNAKQIETLCSSARVDGAWACFGNDERRPSTENYNSIGCMMEVDCNAKTCGGRRFLAIYPDDACLTARPGYEYACYCEK